MNYIDNATKVFLVPDGADNFEFVALKSNVTLAVSEQALYEVKELGPSSQYDKRPEPKLQSGEPVKSLIIEPTTGSDRGSVVSNPMMISFTKFDMLYPLIKWMTSQSELYTTRYHTSGDILDGFSACLKDPQQIPLLGPSIVSCLGSLCEEIEENGEAFYKLNSEKLYAFLETKVQRLVRVLSENPDFAISNSITESLSGVSGSVPQGVLALQTLKYSIHFLFGSYLDPKLMQSYIDAKNHDFLSLNAFIAEREKAEKARTVAEDNMSIGNSKPQQNGQAQKSKGPQSKKKPVKKVAVGKGALDSFFKRK